MANDGSVLKVYCWRDVIAFCEDTENEFCKLTFRSLF